MVYDRNGTYLTASSTLIRAPVFCLAILLSSVSVDGEAMGCRRTDAYETVCNLRTAVPPMWVLWKCFRFSEGRSDM